LGGYTSVMEDHKNASIVEIDTCATCKATAKFDVVLSAPTAAPVSVHYVTANAGATAPADYTAKNNGTLSFTVGGTRHKFISVVTIGDTTPEGTERINVVFSNPVNVVFGNGSIGTIDILDND
jgi:hypothetical protein